MLPSSRLRKSSLLQRSLFSRKIHIIVPLFDTSITIWMFGISLYSHGTCSQVTLKNLHRVLCFYAARRLYTNVGFWLYRQNMLAFHFIDSKHVAIPVYTRLFSIKSARKGTDQNFSHSFHSFHHQQDETSDLIPHVQLARCFGLARWLCDVLMMVWNLSVKCRENCWIIGYCLNWNSLGFGYCR